MKAAVMYPENATPVYTNFNAPTPGNSNQTLLNVEAAALKNLDKMQASGKHYSTESNAPEAKVVGGDCVGRLPNGNRVYAMGVSGTMAQQAIVHTNMMVPVPDGLDSVTAAALPNAILGSALALLFRAQLQPTENILINGATGVTGQMAVQLAKHYGAKHIIVTGRNPETLAPLKKLGATQTVVLTQDNSNLLTQFKTINNNTPINVVIDYLWGNSAMVLLKALKGNGGFSHNTRYVNVGAMSGDTIEISSQILRSTNLQLVGSGLGSWTPQQMQQVFTQILPEMFQLAAKNKLTINCKAVPLQEVATVWNQKAATGQRLVLQP